MEVLEYKNRLIELGINKKLVEMPAVTDEILTLACLGNIPFEKFDKMIEVTSANEVRIQGKKVVLNGDGTASIEEYMGDRLIVKVTTDKDGMEDERELFYSDKLSVIYRRKGGFISKIIEVEPDGDCIVQNCFDCGHVNLERASEISLEDNYGRQISFDTSDIWELFERNKKRTLKKYQHLEAYYDNLGRRIENRIAAERSPERKISAEANEMENLEVECRRLARELESEMRFLNINLEFLEAIKKHSVGKKLFKKYLNKYCEEIGSLVDDNDDQKNEEKNGEDEEKTDLEKLRERRERLEKQLKSTKVRRDVAFKYVGDIVKEPTIKVASVFPIYARYDAKIRGYYKDILGRNER